MQIFQEVPLPQNMPPSPQPSFNLFRGFITENMRSLHFVSTIHQTATFTGFFVSRIFFFLCICLWDVAVGCVFSPDIIKLENLQLKRETICTALLEDRNNSQYLTKQHVDREGALKALFISIPLSDQHLNFKNTVL